MGNDNNPGRTAEKRRIDGDSRLEVDRRDYLRFGSAAVGAAALPVVVSDRGAAATPTRMADPSPSDAEVGGGQAYYESSDYDPVTEDDASTVIAPGDSKSKLLNAMTTTGETIYLRDGVEMDLSGERDIRVESNVTVASDRGKNGNRGALLYFDDYTPNGSLVETYDGGIRFTGLRLEGPRTDYFDPGSGSYDDHFSEGLHFVNERSDNDAETGYNVEIDNCQFYGWSGQAITVGARSWAGNAHVHHCSFHNNQMEGYGYGVHLINGQSLVDYCYFDLNRHCIAGYGWETNGYEAHHNVVERPISHAFDMHRLEENGQGESEKDSDGTPWEWTAGSTIDVHHNQFRFTTDELGRAQEGVTVRGHPYDHCYIDNNQFAHPNQPDSTNVDENGQAFRQKTTGADDSWENLTYSGNEYGVSNFDDHFGSDSPKGGTVGTARETGYVTIDNSTGSAWFTESLNHSFTDPVAFLKPFTYNGSDPVHARLRNVASDSFDMTLEEWDYDDGTHNTETGHFLVVDQGVHVTSNDVPYEAGTVTADESWASVTFDQNFASTPVVFTQAQTTNGPDAIVTRTRDVTSSGFETRLWEQESLDGQGHRDETVGYFAIEPGIADFGDATVEVGTATVDETWTQISFDQSHDTIQRFLASVQSYNGWNPVNLRRRNLNGTGVELFLQEETSADTETGHKAETVGYLVTTTSASF